MAGSDDARSVMERFVELANRAEFDALDALVDIERYVGHIPFPTEAPGWAGEKAVYKTNQGALPDMGFGVDGVLVEGNFAVARGPAGGHHSGAPMFGIPASGKLLKWTAMDAIRVENGKVVERWLEANAVSLMQQLGAIPAPPGALDPQPTPVPPTNSGPRTSVAENKATVTRFIEEVWNKGNLDVADEVFHPGATSPSAPQLPTGGAGVRLIANMFRTAFPDYWIRIDFMVAEGDEVFARFTQGGTHQGELMGIPATGRKVEFTEMGWLRFEGGKVVESWYETNMLGLMAQLGVGG